MPYEYIAPDQSGNNELDMDKLFDAFADWAKQLNYDIHLSEKEIEDLKSRLGGMADYVVEQGTSSGWTYRKWNSGVAECWTITTGESVRFDRWWHNVASYTTRSYAYPSGLFNDSPSSNVFIHSGNGLLSASAQSNTASEIIVYLASHDGSALTNTYTIRLAIHATGRWK